VLRSGRRSRKFESCHLDHKETQYLSHLLGFLMPENRYSFNLPFTELYIVLDKK